MTAIVCFLLGIPSALSVTGILNPFQIGGKTIFDWFDFITAYVLMPLGGLIVTLFTGNAWKRAGEEPGLTGFWYKVWMFLLRVVSPILIVLISCTRKKERKETAVSLRSFFGFFLK